MCEPPCQAPGFCSSEMSKCFCGDRDLDYVTESCENGEISLNVSRVPLSLDLMSSTQCFFSCVHIELVPMDRETMPCSWTGGNLLCSFKDGVTKSCQYLSILFISFFFCTRGFGAVHTSPYSLLGLLRLLTGKEAC